MCIQDEAFALSPRKCWRFSSSSSSGELMRREGAKFRWKNKRTKNKKTSAYIPSTELWDTSEESDNFKFIWLCVIQITPDTLGLNRCRLFSIDATHVPHTHINAQAVKVCNISATMCVSEWKWTSVVGACASGRACASCPQKTTTHSANCVASLVSHKHTLPHHSFSVKSHYARPAS